MAIWDNSVTTSNKIAKLWDNSVTTSNKISKVWNVEGTTNYLLYSTDYKLIGSDYEYTGGWEKYDKTPQYETDDGIDPDGQIDDVTDDIYWDNNAEMSSKNPTTSLTLYAECNYTVITGMVNAYTVEKIDLTGCDTLSITISNMSSGSTGYLAIASAVPADGGLVGMDKSPLDSKYATDIEYNGATIRFDKFIKFTAAGTYNLDVSDFSSSYHICLSFRSYYNSGNTRDSMKITNLSLE